MARFKNYPPICILGAGRVGLTVGYDYLAHTGEKVIFFDTNLENLKKSQALLSPLGEVKIFKVDIREGDKIMELGAEAHLFVGAASYTLNLDLSKRAIESGRHWVDLGGNTKVVEEILKLGEVAKEKRVCLVPDTGLQPGLGNIVAGEINKWLVGAQKIKIIVGGLPVFPEGELKYREVFSIEGLLNEYLGKVQILRDGKEKEMEPFSEVEEISWQGMERLEAFHTSGSASTLINTFKGLIDSLEVKTLRYLGHSESWKKLREKVPENLLKEYLEETLIKSGEDLVLMRVTGEKAGKSWNFELEDSGDEGKGGFSAMERCTGFTAAIVIEMILEEKIPFGAVIQERDVPGSEVFRRLEERGMRIKVWPMEL